MRRKTSTCDVALVQLRYGVYNSPAPASFLRVGKTHSTANQTCSPDQYILLDVGPEIATGAIGVVHNAELQVSTTSDGIKSLKVVVKFAFKRWQRKKLRHEFSIYEHLSSSGIDGIPIAFGLFEDTDSDTLALVMTHVGICLLDRASSILEVKVTNSERFVLCQQQELED